VEIVCLCRVSAVTIFVSCKVPGSDQAEGNDSVNVLNAQEAFLGDDRNIN
jgi:hypothetical protein